jgi:hypothetical protein
MDERSGLRASRRPKEEHPDTHTALEFPSADIAEFLLGHIRRAFRQEEFFVQRLRTDVPTYQVRKEDLAFTLIQNGPEIILLAPPDQQHIAKLMVLEEVLALEDLLESARKVGNLQTVQSELAKGLFGP